MSRREAVLSALAVFAVAVAMRAWAATHITFPRPEDVAYYVGVARNLVEGRGLVTDAIWSFGTPPLVFPRPAFEVWLPLPSFLMTVPMLFLGTTFAAAQVVSVLVGAIVCVLGWVLAAEIAIERRLPQGRARMLALGTGLTTAVYLPLVLASVQPDSTMPFAALALGACLVMARIGRIHARERIRAHRSGWLALLGLLLGLSALARNEAIWLALTWAFVAWRIAARPAGYHHLPAEEPHPRATLAERLRTWIALVGVPAVLSLLVFAPWAIRDWLDFGSPFPGQALTNALSLQGTDIFAWQVQPTLDRYLDAGLPRLLELRAIGIFHNVVYVLLLLGVPLSVMGSIGLLDVLRTPGLRPLVLASVLTFLSASLLFPVATTWGTFLHAAGSIHVLLVLSSMLVLDRLLARVAHLRGWTRPTAWLGPAFAIAGSLLFSAVLLPLDGRLARATGDRYAALAVALEDPAFEMRLSEEPGPVITDFPIWFAEATRHRALALPQEPIESILDMARSFDPPARLLVVEAGNPGVWPGTILAGDPGADCFVPLEIPELPDAPGALDDVLAFRIRCP